MEKTTLVQYKTSDNQTFTDKAKATQHEAKIQLTSVLGVQSPVAEKLLSEYSQVLDILNAVRKASKPAKVKAEKKDKKPASV